MTTFGNSALIAILLAGASGQNADSNVRGLVVAELVAVPHPVQTACGVASFTEKRIYRLVETRSGSVEADPTSKQFVAYVLCPEFHVKAQIGKNYLLRLVTPQTGPCRLWTPQVPDERFTYCAEATEEMSVPAG
jgi:hypothetical protein